MNTMLCEVPHVTAEFLSTFIVNAQGGIMRARRQKGVYVIIPKNACVQPTYVTIHWIHPRRIQNLPILMDGEGLISRILQVSPIEANFLRPIVFVIPCFGLLNRKEREIVILRSDNGKTWTEHGLKDNCNFDEILNTNLINQLKYVKNLQTNSYVSIATLTLPHYFAVISRLRQDITSIGLNGGIICSQFMPLVKIIFQPETVKKTILIGLQVLPFNLEKWVNLNCMVLSPIITIEPRCRKFRKPITVQIPFQQNNFNLNNCNHNKNILNVRLLCSTTRCQKSATWKDVTGSTILSYENNCVMFTTKITGRYWAIYCKDNEDSNIIALKFYEHMMRIPYIVKILVYGKRISPNEAKLSIHFLIDYNEERTLEYDGSLNKIATSDDIELFDNQHINLKFDNFMPIVRYEKELSFKFMPFENNNLRFVVNILNSNNLEDCVTLLSVSTIFKEIICTLSISLR